MATKRKKQPIEQQPIEVEHLNPAERELLEVARAKFASRPNIEIVNVAVDALEPVAWNPREISSKDREDLKRSLATFGCVEPLIVRKEDMSIVGGHQRYYAALDLEWPDIPCVIIDLTENEAKLLNLALNSIGGVFVQDKLDILLAELAVAGMDISLAGYEIDIGLPDVIAETTFQESEVPKMERANKRIIKKCPKCGYILTANYGTN